MRDLDMADVLDDADRLREDYEYDRRMRRSRDIKIATARTARWCVVYGVVKPVGHEPAHLVVGDDRTCCRQKPCSEAAGHGARAVKLARARAARHGF